MDAVIHISVHKYEAFFSHLLQAYWPDQKKTQLFIDETCAQQLFTL